MTQALGSAETAAHVLFIERNTCGCIWTSLSTPNPHSKKKLILLTERIAYTYACAADIFDSRNYKERQVHVMQRRFFW